MLKDFLNKNLPKNKNLNYKNILIVIGVIVILIFIPFFIKAAKKNTKDKNLDTSKTFLSTYNKPEIDNIVNSSKNTKENLVIKTLEEQKEKKEEEKPYEITEEQKLLIEEYKLQRKILQARKNAPLEIISNSTQKDNEPSNPSFPDFTIPPYPEMETDYNYQKKKAEFLKESAIDNFVLQKPLTPALSPYEVKAGTIIPITLITRINTDNPGNILGYIKSDVYDSKTGRVLLIPAGSKIIGRYNSNVSFGQERAQFVFNRITLPNQKSINIGSMIGVDQMGQSGAKDKINNHMGKVFTSVIMSAILGAGTAVVTEEDDDNTSYTSEAGQGAGEQILEIGSNYSNKVLNVQPTLEITQSKTVGVFIDKDLLLEPYL